jgi:hypothetical protein
MHPYVKAILVALSAGLVSGVVGWIGVFCYLAWRLSRDEGGS